MNSKSRRFSIACSGTAVLHWIVGYRRRCDTLPVRSTVEPGYLRAMVPLTAPEQGWNFTGTESTVAAIYLIFIHVFSYYIL